MSADDESGRVSEVSVSAVELAQLQEMRRAFEPVDPKLAEILQSFDCDGAIPKCREEVEALWLVADGGCDVKLRARLEAHFERCSSCHAQYEVEIRIKELLSKKCKSEPCAPEGLKDKLRGEIRNMLNVSHPRVEARPETAD
ncbi:mycothiol system anti-sigma-R factor [Segniliparus rugosus]|uniref:Mycothiol system anti-sigma-R factor n=1 Tax=Segniliparus rugosus (strain ATCC BAA-974 / DSM 45345 / CCUG 50838 / CIP 108380 / JCM 13579 / CDC 945) TaxID=679197 RepID=E5XRJ0_SEGRC|nr:mycothiol system anti-sigma-R factor [Segniliparus rugosus]EFV13035.2 mycothiol system anti-sigma-R factor [Segniliparus rugosus ATCC BAA-974]